MATNCAVHFIMYSICFEVAIRINCCHHRLSTACEASTNVLVLCGRQSCKRACVKSCYKEINIQAVIWGNMVSLFILYFSSCGHCAHQYSHCSKCTKLANHWFACFIVSNDLVWLHDKSMCKYMWLGLRKSTMWVQITPSYIYANIFRSEWTIPFP